MAQAEPARTYERDEQRLQGMPDHGLFAPAVLRDPTQLSDLRGRRPHRPAPRRQGSTSQPSLRTGRGRDPGACPRESHPWRAARRPGTVAQGRPCLLGRGARRVVPPQAADQTRAAVRLEKTTSERRIELSDEQVQLLERFSPEFRERHIQTRHPES